jgi:GTP-binding protein YchF
MLSDMESLEKRIEKAAKKGQNNTKEMKEQLELMEEALAILQKGDSQQVDSRNARLGAGRFKQLNILSDKPVLIVCNVAERDAVLGNNFTKEVKQYVASRNIEVVIISASIESEIASLGSAEEQANFLKSMGLAESGLAKVIKAGYKLLNLETFFTAGPAETRAWSIAQNTKAPEAAGEIHTDFKRGFICAETIHYDDYVRYEGELGAKTAGKMRIEGKEYVVCDGDVMHFRFNV